MLRRVLPLLVTLLAIAATAQNWTEVRTEHFAVISSQGDRKTIAAAQTAEQLRDVMGQLLARRDLHIPAPAYIVIFRTPAEMQEVFGSLGSPGEVAATAPDVALFAYDGSSEDAINAFQRDFGRFLLDANYPPTPPWFDEGLAEYFSTTRIDQGIQLSSGAPPADVATVLQGPGWIPVADIFSAAADSSRRNDPHFRAEAWAIVRYVFTNQQLAQTGQYFALTLNQHVAVAEAIPQAFSMTPEQLDAAVRSSLHWPINASKDNSAPSPPAPDGLKVYVESPVDLRALAADFALHGPGGATDLAALEQAGDNVDAQRALGYAYLQKKDFQHAGEALKRAARLAPEDVRTRYYIGLLAAREMEAGGGDASLNAPMALRSLVRDDPEFADAQALYGQSLLDFGEQVDAIRALQAATHLAPRNEAYLLALAKAYLQARDFDDAEPLLNRLAGSRNPQIASEAAKKRDTIAELKKAPQQSGVYVGAYHYDDKQWGTPGGYADIPSLDQLDKLAKQREKEENSKPAPDTRPVRYVRGHLMSVDCSDAPGVVLTVNINTKPVTFYAKSAASVPVIGAASLSCSLRDREVALNYRPGSSHADNDLVSVELK